MEGGRREAESSAAFGGPVARQLRIEHPGAFYHVYSRGNQRQMVFLSDEDRYYFLKVLGDANEKFGMRFSAYCLMPNHYHLFAETPWGGLSKAMHLINTTYTVYFNKKHTRCGHLFQGRFKSILVEAETYAWELSRYVHLNPVRAGIVCLPEDYPWSSYRDYLGLRRSISWLDTSLVLGDSANLSKESRNCYAKFVLAGIGGEPPSGYNEAKRSGVLGSSAFMDRIKGQHLEIGGSIQDREKPQLRFFRTRPEIADILVLTKKELGPQNKFVKNLTILVCQHAMGYQLKEIGSFFKMSISGISNGRRRIQKEMVHNEALDAAFQRIVSASMSRPERPDR